MNRMGLHDHPHVKAIRYEERDDRKSGRKKRVLVLQTDLPIPKDAILGGDRPVELILAELTAAGLRQGLVDAVTIRPVRRVKVRLRAGPMGPRDRGAADIAGNEGPE